MLVLVEWKFFREPRVLVAVQLHQEQEQPGEHQRGVRHLAELRERGGLAPARQDDPHAGERRDLAQLHAEIEREDAQHETFLAERERLQAGGKSEAVNQSEHEHRHEQVGRLHLNVFPEPVEIVERLVTDGQGNHGIHEVVVRLDVQQRGEDQCEAMADREGRDKLHHIPQPRQKEHHAKQEEQMIVARQHVSRAEFEIFEVAAFQNALLVRVGDPMRGSGQRGQQAGEDWSDRLHVIGLSAAVTLFQC